MSVRQTFGKLDVCSIQAFLDFSGAVLSSAGDLLAGAFQPLLATSEPGLGCLLQISRVLPFVLTLHVGKQLGR